MVPADHRVKLKESEKREKYLAIVRELKKTIEYESDDDTNSNWRSWNSPQRLVKRLEDLEIRGQLETIQTTELVRSTKILRKVLET